jgi:hypothetical protein
MAEPPNETTVASAAHAAPTPIRLLLKWSERARANQLQHWEAARYYDSANLALGGPAAVLSAVVGTTVFATLDKQVDFKVQLAVGATSVLAAILVALQTFLRLSEKAEKHRGTAAAYSSVRRKIEVTLSLRDGSQEPLTRTVEEVLRELDNLAESAPTVPRHIWRKTKRELGEHESFLTTEFSRDTGGARLQGPADPYRP